MLKILILLIAISIIIATLLQPSKSEGLRALSGNLSLFAVNKERGVEKVMVIITTVLACLFFLLIVLEKVVA